MREKHGLSDHPLYKTWNNVTQRVKSNMYYKDIGICDDWLIFTNFYNWAIKNGWSKDLTIDRIDNLGDYEPSNCRWVDHKTQMNNTSRNRIISYNGVEKNLGYWCNKYSINRDTFNKRLKLGWSIEKIIETKKVIRDIVVYQYSKNDVFIKKFDSIASASNETGISSSTISLVCNKSKKHKTAGGFKWYKEKDIINLNKQVNDKT